MTVTEEETIPYWNVNVERSKWTDEPSEALANVNEFDRNHLSIKDEDFHVLTWPEVQDVVKTNRLEVFMRKPSDLRNYREHMGIIKNQYGSVMNFILKERVQWSDLTPKAGPFQESSDLKILCNDWPYGIDPRIVHLVVWVKFDFAEDPSTGDLTPTARKQIDDYVTATFRKGENPNHVAWFKNWAALKSVHAIEHFHVMLFDPDPKLVAEVTGNDVSMSQQLAEGEKSLDGRC